MTGPVQITAVTENDTQSPQQIFCLDHAAYVTELATTQSTGLGRRNATSGTGADESTGSPECAISDAIDLSGNASTVVYPGPCKVLGIWVEVTLGTAAATLDDNATTRMTIPVALPIGAHALPGVIFESNLTVNPADTTTGTIRVLYRPLDPSVVWAY